MEFSVDLARLPRQREGLPNAKLLLLIAGEYEELTIVFFGVYF